MASTTYEQKRFCEIKRCGKIDHFGNVPVMVRTPDSCRSLFG